MMRKLLSILIVLAMMCTAGTVFAETGASFSIKTRFSFLTGISYLAYLDQKPHNHAHLQPYPPA